MFTLIACALSFAAGWCGHRLYWYVRMHSEQLRP